MKLREYLDKNGLRYRHFAIKIGVTPDYLLQIMKKERNISLTIARRIVNATLMNVSYEDLCLEGTEEKPKPKTRRKT